MLLHASLSISREEITRLTKDLVTFAGSTFVMVPDTGPGARAKRNLRVLVLVVVDMVFLPIVLGFGSCGDADGKLDYKTAKGIFHTLLNFSLR